MAILVGLWRFPVGNEGWKSEFGGLFTTYTAIAMIYELHIDTHCSVTY